MNFYFFNRKNPSDTSKHFLRIVSSNTDDNETYEQLEKFFEEHYLTTIGMDEEAIVVSFDNCCYSMLIYLDRMDHDTIDVESEDWEGNPVSFSIPVKRFAIYEDGTNLIMGEAV